MVLALEQQLLAQVRQGDRSTDLPVGTLTFGNVDRQHPSYGEIDGQPVTMIGEGNRIGFSPVTLVRDLDGEEAWIPKNRIRNTDPRLAPIAFTAGPVGIPLPSPAARARSRRPAKIAKATA